MSARLIADVVVVIHFGFVVFVVIGGLLALRWPRALWLHVPSVIYSIWIITFSINCPLTSIERDLRYRAGEGRYQESFIERYVEGVLYPGDMLRQAQAVAAVIVVGSYVALRIRGRTRGGRLAVGPGAEVAAAADDMAI
ncbi:MAG: DUF2784 domain-containing protein [Acidimicrobiales bacterium]